MTILSQVISGRVLSPLRILAYGPPGVGKTSFANQAPNVLFQQIEDGFGKMAANRLPRPKDFRELKRQAIGVRDEPHSYGTFAVDTLDRVEELIWAEVAKEQGVESVAHIPFRNGYEMALVKWREYLSLLEDIRDQRRMNIVVIGHSVVDKFDSPDLDIGSFNFYRLDLHKKAAPMIKDWCDLVLFFNHKIATKKEKGQSEKGVDLGKRSIYTEDRPSHWGKNRFDLPYELPFEPGAGWSVLEEALKNSLSN